LRLRPSGFEKSADSNCAICPSPTPKKSPTGALTAGFAAPSQNISSLNPRSICGLRSGIVIQMRRTMPGLFFASASTTLAPALMGMVGAPLRPPPATPARPFSPVGFSGLAQRVSNSCISYRDCDCAPAAHIKQSKVESEIVFTSNFIRPLRVCKGQYHPR
jgi:hypothetical protein